MNNVQRQIHDEDAASIHPLKPKVRRRVFGRNLSRLFMKNDDASEKRQ
jgi:hypothetical protein